MNADCAAVLALLEQEDGVSAARACKRLGLSRSELQRCLSVLGEDESIGGLALVQIVPMQGRDVLRLTERARTARQTP
jgi:predicted ArsR family transcriptional regulator